MTALGDAIDPIEFAVTGHGDEEEEDDHGPLDPHFWFDPMRVKLAVNDIAEHLALLDAIEDSVIRQRLIEAGVRRCDDFSWVKAAHETFRVYQKLV